MKKLLILLFSFFLLSSPSVFADDISDFKIEGISIGDSLLDYMTEEEILEEIERNKNDYSHLKDPNKYIEIYFWKEFPPYDRISVFIKNNSLNKYVSNSNEKFKILSTFGSIYYVNDIGNCRVKKQEIMDVVSGMFPDKKIQESTRPHRGDPSGDSRLESFAVFFPSGSSIQVGCTDFEETFRIKSNQTEGLNFSIVSEEILNWFNNK
jgi:hypothetical protein